MASRTNPPRRPPGLQRAAQAVPFALGLACGDADLPADVGGDPFWSPLDISAAEDLGDPARAISAAEQVAAGPITLVDRSAATGVEAFVAGGNTHGVGAAFTDLDGDDWPDIVVVSGTSNRTGEVFGSVHLRNRGDGTFEAATGSGVAEALAGLDAYSIAAGDLDGDGDIDLYIGAQPRDVLLRNAGDGTFEDVTSAAGAGGPMSDATLVRDGKSKVVSIADFDNDGFLDLTSASSTLPAPGAYLLRNRADGTFEDITGSSGIKVHPAGNPCAVMWSDFDNDGDRDLWIWNDRGGKVLLRNDGGQQLVDITKAAGLEAVEIINPMGIDAADIDHDGDLDYYIANIRNNPLLRNNGDGTFVDITASAGTGGEYSWGLAFEDFDADGWADLFVTQEDDLPYLVFRNLGQSPPRFEQSDLPHPAVVDEAAAHNVAAAFADYDHDGRVDVIVAHTDGSALQLYRNETDLGTRGWLDVIVSPPPAEIAAGGLGARVVLSVDSELRFRDITGGSSRASQNEMTARFGLGQYTGAQWVAVQWPTGRQTVFTGVAAGQRLRVQ